jgi:hypothetical protein
MDNERDDVGDDDDEDVGEERDTNLKRRKRGDRVIGQDVWKVCEVAQRKAASIVRRAILISIMTLYIDNHL